MHKLINCKKAIFGDGTESKGNYSFLIHNNKIEELGESGSFETPANAEIFNLEDYFILPGLPTCFKAVFGSKQVPLN